jgi:hypothetical protein
MGSSVSVEDEVKKAVDAVESIVSEEALDSALDSVVKLAAESKRLEEEVARKKMLLERRPLQVFDDERTNERTNNGFPRCLF